MNFCYVCCSETTLLFQKYMICSKNWHNLCQSRHEYYNYYLSLLVEDSQHRQESEEESLFQRQAEPQTHHCVGCGSVSKALKTEQCY